MRLDKFIELNSYDFYLMSEGDLHWKQVSFNINSNWEVVAKMKSKHIGGTFTKKKKCM